MEILNEAQHTLDSHMTAIASYEHLPKLVFFIYDRYQHYATRIITSYLKLSSIYEKNEGGACDSTDIRDYALHCAYKLLTMMEKYALLSGIRNSSNPSNKTPSKSSSTEESALTGNLKQLLEMNAENISVEPEKMSVPIDFMVERVYNSLIGAFSKSAAQASDRKGEYLSKAESILKSMESYIELEAGQNFLVDVTNCHFVERHRQCIGRAPPNAKSYSLVINGYGRVNDAKRALYWLHRMEDRYDDYVAATKKLLPMPPVPNIICYNSVINAYAKSGNPMMAQGMLDHMKERQHLLRTLLDDEDEAESVAAAAQPDVVSYTSVIDAWTRWWERDNDGKGIDFSPVQAAAHISKQAERTVRRMEQESRKIKEPKAPSSPLQSHSTPSSECTSITAAKIQPNLVTYNALINAYCKSAKLLGRDSQNNAVRNSGNIAHAAYSAAKKAEGVLTQMSKNGVTPDYVSYSTVIHAWAAAAAAAACKKGSARSKNGRNIRLRVALDSAEQAERVLFNMEAMNVKDGDVNMKPTVMLYNMVITAWGRSKTGVGVERARKIIARMEKRLLQDEENAVSPNVVTYTTFINALANTCHKGDAQKAEQVLLKMEEMHRAGAVDMKPNVFTYNTVLNAWAKSRHWDAAPNAERILSRMEAMRITGLSTVEPDIFSYCTVIDAWGKSGDHSAGEKAQLVLNRMEQLHDHYGWDGLKPNVVVYNACIHAWAACQDLVSGEKATEIVEKMEKLYMDGNDDVMPDFVTYTGVINSWAKSSAPHSADMAERVLERMEQLYLSGRGNIRPNIVTYNAVLNAFASCRDNDAPIRAEALLRRMEIMAQSKQHGKAAVPDATSYNTVINAWARSGRTDKAKRALFLLSKMDGQYHRGSKRPKSDIISFNSVLNACATTPSAHKHSGEENIQLDAFRIAMRILGEMKSSQRIQPNHVTYGTLIKACATLLPIGEERTTLLGRVFQECSREGHLSDSVIRSLRMAAPPALFSKLVKAS